MHCKINYPSIIAVGGLKNSGKDTSADMIQYLYSTFQFPFLQTYKAYKVWTKINFFCERYFEFKFPYSISKVSFATSLKKCLSLILNISEERFDDRYFKEHAYVYFPNLSIKFHPKQEMSISDTKLNKALASKDYSFIQNNYLTIRQVLQVFGTNIMREIFGDKLWVLNTLMKCKGPVIISDLRFKIEMEELQNCEAITIFIKRDECKPGKHSSEKELLEIQNQFTYIVDNNASLEHLFNNLKTIVYEISPS